MNNHLLLYTEFEKPDSFNQKIVESFEIASQFIDIIIHYRNTDPQQTHTKRILQ